MQGIDLTEAAQKIKEKIKDTFATLIPEEQWNEMVQKEINNYFKQTEEGYGQRGYSSSFQKDVHSVLSDETKQRVKEYLQTNFDSVWYENGVSVCNKYVEDIITKNAGKILSDMIGGSIQMALSNAGFRM